ncbi:metallophosphoesterase family protein [Natronoarchaeum philippinense]|nr:metallophosphoesterase family protein [Natronoarchaeum philippinense]
MPEQTTDSDWSPERAFSDAVEQRHHRIDADEWQNVYVIGDIHGCLTELKALVERIDPDPDELLAFVGDLVRKGPDSAGVVEYVRDRPNAVPVLGNNEAKVLRGDADPGLDDEHVDYLETLPAVLSWGDHAVVHGGVDPSRPLFEHGVEDFLTMRAPLGDGYDGPFWFEQYERTPQVFFGHTVLDAPVVGEGAIGLDTGCVYGGALTAYDCGADEFVSVPARDTYQERSRSKFVDPSEHDVDAGGQ